MNTEPKPLQCWVSEFLGNDMPTMAVKLLKNSPQHEIDSIPNDYFNGAELHILKEFGWNYEKVLECQKT